MTPTQTQVHSVAVRGANNLTVAFSPEELSRIARIAEYLRTVPPHNAHDLVGHIDGLARLEGPVRIDDFADGNNVDRIDDLEDAANAEGSAHIDDRSSNLVPVDVHPPADTLVYEDSVGENLLNGNAREGARIRTGVRRAPDTVARTGRATCARSAMFALGCALAFTFVGPAINVAVGFSPGICVVVPGLRACSDPLNITPSLPTSLDLAPSMDLSSAVVAFEGEPLPIASYAFDELTKLQGRLVERLLPRSTSDQLAIDVNFAASTARDLVIAIKASDLKRRDELAQALLDFAQEAKLVGRELQIWSARVHGAIDM